MPKKITFEKAVELFSDRDDIVLCKEGWTSWSEKAKFWDNIEKDYFFAIPRCVYHTNSSHPKRASLKRKKYYMEKFGVEHQMRIREIKNKHRNTIKEKYGVDNISQSDIVKQKKEQTNIKNWDVKNVFESKEIKDKIVKTNIKKYGVSYPQQSEVLREKTKQTNLKKFGVENSSRIASKRFIVETGEHLKDWFDRQPNPKPSYDNVSQSFPNENISLKDVKKYVTNYKPNKTTLEVYVENLLNLEHYNKKPAELESTYRPDFKISDKVFVNVDGLYWHCELQKERWYHFNLRKDFEKAGLRIIQFYENEVKEKPHICKSIINNAAGKIENKIFARSCTLKPVLHKEAVGFLLNNHTMGSITAKHIGLFYNDQLISLMSYKQKKHICKIERFCSLNGCVVTGGFSKLLKHLENHCLNPEVTEIHNWVDLRYGTGNHLLNKDFVPKRDTLGWRWTDFNTTFNRLRCKANMDERKLTQQQHADELGWHKIYDAGQRCYVKHVKV